MKRILIRPWYATLNDDKLFDVMTGERNHSLQPFARLRELGQEHGIEIATWDRYPLNTADVILFHDLPHARQDMEKARREAPDAMFILMLFESYLGRAHWFRKENHDLFDAVFTYDPALVDGKRYFHYNLPTGVPEEHPSVPYADRRPLVMISTNREARYAGLLGQRQPGWEGLPFLGPLFGGWRVPVHTLPFQLHGETYTRRSQLGRVADRSFPGLLDIYGPGWQGEPISWLHNLVPHRPYASARGLPPGRKMDVLRNYRFSVEYENLHADMNYMCEKIFDCLFAGVVPIYLGNMRVQEQVAPNCFVDARRFASDKQMLAYVQACPQSEWQTMIDAASDTFIPSRFASSCRTLLLSKSSRRSRCYRTGNRLSNPSPGKEVCVCIQFPVFSVG